MGFFATTEIENLSLHITNIKRLIGQIYLCQETLLMYTVGEIFFQKSGGTITASFCQLAYNKTTNSRSHFLDLWVFLDWGKVSSCFIELFEN